MMVKPKAPIAAKASASLLTACHSGCEIRVSSRFIVGLLSGVCVLLKRPRQRLCSLRRRGLFVPISWRNRDGGGPLSATTFAGPESAKWRSQQGRTALKDERHEEWDGNDDRGTHRQQDHRNEGDPRYHKPPSRSQNQ